MEYGHQTDEARLSSIFVWEVVSCAKGKSMSEYSSLEVGDFKEL
jgi:hypothetical protein